jgi:hypothetical protein
MLSGAKFIIINVFIAIIFITVPTVVDLVLDFLLKYRFYRSQVYGNLSFHAVTSKKLNTSLNKL